MPGDRRSRAEIRGRLLLAGAVAMVLAAAPPGLEAQAFTPARGIGSVTLAWQLVDNIPAIVVTVLSLHLLTSYETAQAGTF